MRFHLRRFLWLIFGAFLCSFLMLHFVQLKSEHDLLGFAERGQPWGINFDIDHKHGRIKLVQTHNESYRKGSPTHDLKKMWPVLHEEEITDRIVEQLYKYKSPVMQTKTVVLVGGKKQNAQKRLMSEQCPVTHCEFVNSLSAAPNADAVIFFSGIHSHSKISRPPHQIWGLFMLESPHHTPSLSSISSAAVNWTATYRRDSVLVTPYEKFVHFDNFTLLPDQPARNYSAGKTNLVAWFVSNCNAPNGRLSYVKELQNYISVDIYGACGTHKCPRSNTKHCFDLLNKDYKFYLAFENSNCKDYITEKFYWNALGNDIVPVVMGAHPDDYQAVAPPESYIHVDHFESPKDLATYLHKLDRNPDLYNSYFRWKGTGEFINTKFWCRLCNMVHAADLVPHMAYKDLNKWWRGRNICISPHEKGYASWRGQKINTEFWKNNTVLFER